MEATPPPPALDPADRLARARLALVGLALGDALGGFFEFAGRHAHARVAAQALPAPPWRWTDDTQMACAVVATLQHAGRVDQDHLAAELAGRYERRRGYGLASRAMLARIRRGAAWRAEAAGLFGGAGSFGNGAASRVPPIGAYFADDPAAAAAHAARSAVVTHAHPEAQAGAVAVAVAAALTWQGRDRPADPAHLLDAVWALTPPGAVRDGLRAARELSPDTPVAAAAARLGNGSQVSCPDTVPFALWCAAAPAESFAAAIWRALGGLGDCDTIGAIVGGVVALRTGLASIPAAWRAACEPLPEGLGV